MGKRDKRRSDRKMSRRMRDRQITLHHVPPRSRGGGQVIEVPWYKHKAYHTIFGNAGSYEECCDILLRDWWTVWEELL